MPKDEFLIRRQRRLCEQCLAALKERGNRRDDEIEIEMLLESLKRDTLSLVEEREMNRISDEFGLGRV